MPSRLLLVPLFLLAACDASESLLADSPDAAPAETERGGEARGAIHRPSLWNKTRLTVCFIKRTTPYKDYTLAETNPIEAASRVLVMQAVNGTWDSKTRFDFVWLGDCTGADMADISIRSVDHVNYLGWSIYGAPSADVYPSMKINMPCLTPVSTCVKTGPGGDDAVGGDSGMMGNGCSMSSTQPPPADYNACVVNTAIHEFGHALGLLHEHERADAPPCFGGGATEVTGLWPFDAASKMNYCADDLWTRPSLSAGDIRTVATLYSPQVIASIPGGGRVFGPGRHEGPFNLNSLVIAPGLKVRTCNSNNICSTYTGSVTLNRIVQRVEVSARVWGFEDPGYQGRNALFDLGVNTGAKIDAACNDCISSMIVPHGLQARVCWHEAGGAGDVCTILGGGPEFEHTPYDKLGPDINNQISFVEVIPQAVLYRDKDFKGIGKSFPMGGTIANPLTGASSLIVHAGYHARVCTLANGGGTCAVLTASDNLPASVEDNVKFLETFPAPLTWDPPPGPGPIEPLPF